MSKKSNNRISVVASPTEAKYSTFNASKPKLVPIGKWAPHPEKEKIYGHIVDPWFFFSYGEMILVLSAKDHRTARKLAKAEIEQINNEELEEQISSEEESEISDEAPHPTVNFVINHYMPDEDDLRALVDMSERLIKSGSKK